MTFQLFLNNPEINLRYATLYSLFRALYANVFITEFAPVSIVTDVFTLMVYKNFGKHALYKLCLVLIARQCVVAN